MRNSKTAFRVSSALILQNFICVHLAMRIRIAPYKSKVLIFYFEIETQIIEISVVIFFTEANEKPQFYRAALRSKFRIELLHKHEFRYDFSQM